MPLIKPIFRHITCYLNINNIKGKVPRCLLSVSIKIALHTHTFCPYLYIWPYIYVRIMTKAKENQYENLRIFHTKNHERCTTSCELYVSNILPTLPVVMAIWRAKNPCYLSAVSQRRWWIINDHDISRVQFGLYFPIQDLPPLDKRNGWHNKIPSGLAEIGLQRGHIRPCSKFGKIIKTFLWRVT